MNLVDIFQVTTSKKNSEQHPLKLMKVKNVHMLILTRNVIGLNGFEPNVHQHFPIGFVNDSQRHTIGMKRAIRMYGPQL